ncbi:hypothetical protein CKM354_000908300 [Cercospora kikuchii]|uniref:Major facilitator superfamily (MFS) profile domain-containing protein n=1 Tax=Cercospora kikuchii TaxID=84275 RepID=A0A9P3CQY3_9PEZI|nr:uncharacterized protein CKM354_000908300 [Cercospora kikuchii]GIZ45937.1 hypothetical protein CKM354_000908300 [Cercospora kikuchii]
MASARSAVRSFRGSTAFITFAISYAIFTDQFLFAAIIPVYPYSLEERVGVSKDQVQFWVAILLGVFGLASVVTSLPWGWYTDRTKSRRVPFMVGLLVLLGSTLILWFARTVAGHVVGRALQGLASVVVWTTGLAVLVDTVGQEHIGEYVGYIGIGLNAGSLIAPFLGGIVFAKCGYHAVFGLIVSIIVLDILFRLVMIEKRFRLEAQFSMSTTPCDITLELGPSGDLVNKKKFPSIAIDQLSLSSELTLVPKLDTNTTTPTPTTKPFSSIPPIFRLLASMRFLTSLWGIFILATVFSGFQATLPLFVHTTFSWTSIGSGLIFIPLSLPSLFGPYIGSLCDRHANSSRWFAVAGYMTFCGSLVSLRFVERDTMGHKVMLCGLLCCVGSCMALILEPLFKEVTERAERLEKEDGIAKAASDDAKAGASETSPGYYGSAYAWFNIAWSFGNFVGPLMAGMIMDHAGWKTMTWSLGLLGGVSAIPIGLWCGGWYFSTPSKDEEKK